MICGEVRCSGDVAVSTGFTRFAGSVQGNKVQTVAIAGDFATVWHLSNDLR